MRRNLKVFSKRALTLFLAAVLSLSPAMTAFAEKTGTIVESGAEMEREASNEGETKPGAGAAEGLGENGGEGSGESSEAVTGESTLSETTGTAAKGNGKGTEAATGEATEDETTAGVKETEASKKETEALKDTLTEMAVMADDGSLFTATDTVNGIRVTVKAYSEGVVPEGATVRVSAVESASEDEKDISAALLTAKENPEAHVYKSDTLDIKLIDKDGNVIEPEGEVEVTLSMTTGDMPANIEANVYHLTDKDKTAEDAAGEGVNGSTGDENDDNGEDGVSDTEGIVQVKSDYDNLTDEEIAAILSGYANEDKETVENLNIDAILLDASRQKEALESGEASVMMLGADAVSMGTFSFRAGAGAGEESGSVDALAEDAGEALGMEDGDYAFGLSDEYYASSEYGELMEINEEDLKFEAEKLVINVDETPVEDLIENSITEAKGSGSGIATPSNYVNLNAAGTEAAGISEKKAEALKRDAKANDAVNITTITFTTTGFSYYVVEFTYNEIEYVIDGDSSVELKVLLNAVGITDYEHIDSVKVSDPTLFNAELRKENEADEGTWYVNTLNPFVTLEWMHVTLDGKRYDIDVTDRTDYMKLTGNKETREIKIDKRNEMVIDLNGYVLTRGDTNPDKIYYASDTFSSGNLFYLNWYTKLTIKSSNTTRRHAGRLIKAYSQDGNSAYDGYVWYHDGKGDTVLTGGIITGGASDSKERGGAITMMPETELILENVTIAGNVADNSWSGADSGYGGAIHAIHDSTIKMTNSRICYNYAENGGGGVRIEYDSTLIMDAKSSIDHNCTEGSGGGIMGRYGTSEDILVRGGSVSFNKAKRSGGGIYFVESGCSVENMTIQGNFSGNRGGGILMANGSRVSNCVIKENRAQYGGGMYIGDATLYRLTVTNNEAGKSGGGILATKKIYDSSSSDVYVYLSGKMTVKDNLVNGNSMTQPAGFDKTADFYLDEHTWINDPPDNGSEIWIAANTYRRLTSKGGPVNGQVFHTNKALGSVYWDNDNLSKTYRHVVYTSEQADKYEVKKIKIRPGEAKDLDGNGVITGDERGTAPVVWNAEKYEINADDNLDNSLINKNDFIGSYDILNGITRSECTDDTLYSYFYSDGYFFADPKKYDPHLSTMSLILEKTAFNANTSSDSEKNPIGYINKFRAVKQLLTDIGCDDGDIYISETYTVAPTDETIGFAIGSKSLKKPDGTDSGYILVPVVVRGGGYELEWMSNVTLGKNGEAEGFMDAADQVFVGVKRFINEKGLNAAVNAGRVRFWVVGYSRGGATANLTSKRLIDQYQSDGNAVYGYTFEAPQGGSPSELRSDVSYDSIHNIQNYSDIVTYVAPIDMGFMRYGVDHYVPGDPETVSGSSPTTGYSFYDGYSRYYAGSLMGINNLGGGVLGDVYRRDNNHWDTNTEKYALQKRLMLQQLATMEPNRVFDDYFAEAMLTELRGLVGSGGYVRETGVKGTTMGTWIGDFIHNFLFWGLGSVTNKKVFNARPTYVDKKAESALRTAMRIKETLDDKQMEKINDMASRKWFMVRMAYWYGDGIDGRTGENLYDIFNSYGIFDKDCLDMNATEAKELLTLLVNVFNGDLLNNYYYGTGVARDYTIGENYNIMLGTLLYNIGNIGANHVPEVNLAWLRSYDSYYDKDKTDNYGESIAKTCYYIYLADKEELTSPEFSVYATYGSGDMTKLIRKDVEVIVTRDATGKITDTRYETVTSVTDKNGTTVTREATKTNGPNQSLFFVVAMPDGMNPGTAYVEMHPSGENEGGAAYFDTDVLYRGPVSLDDIQKDSPTWWSVSGYTRWFDTKGPEATFYINQVDPMSEIEGYVTISRHMDGMKLYASPRINDKVNPDEFLTYQYVWKRNGVVVPGETGNTYFVHGEDMGQIISCDVSAVGKLGIISSRDFGPLSPAVYDKPDRPELLKRDGFYDFTIKSMYGCEYQMVHDDDQSLLKDDAWTEDTTFNILDVGTDGYIFARYKAYSEDVGGVPVMIVAPSLISYSLHIHCDEALNGEAYLAGDAVYDETLYVVVTDIDADDTKFIYEWLSDGELIPGAAGDEYVVKAGDIGKRISCRITSSVAPGAIYSEKTEPVAKAQQAPPEAPELISSDSYSITIKNVTGREYSIDDGLTWESGSGTSFTFDQLKPGTEYEIVARKAESYCYEASVASGKLIVSTGAAPALTGDISFATDEFIYNSDILVYFENTNNTGNLSYAWYRSDTRTDIGTRVETNNSPIYMISTEDVGKYITVSVTSSIETGSISLTTATPVMKASQMAPEMPVLTEKTATGISIKVLTGCEYQLLTGSGDPSGLIETNWVQTGTFTGLNTADNDYFIFARKKATEGYNESKPSTPLYVGANGLHGAGKLKNTNAGESLYNACVFGETLRAEVVLTDTALTGSAVKYRVKRHSAGVDPVNVTEGSITLTGLNGYVDYVLTASDIGRMISVEFYVDGRLGSIETGLSYEIRKLPQDAPNAPKVTVETGNPGLSTIKVDVPAGEQVSIDGSGRWYPATALTADSTYTFTGLKEDTEYRIYARLAETGTMAASPSSKPLIVSTDIEFNVIISGDQTVGRTLEAFITGGIGNHEVKYEWFSVNPLNGDETLIEGENGKCYTVRALDSGMKVACKVTASDILKARKAVTGVIVNANQAVPGVPELIKTGGVLKIKATEGIDYEIGVSENGPWLGLVNNPSGLDIDILTYAQTTYGLTSFVVRSVRQARTGYNAAYSGAIKVAAGSEPLTGKVTISGEARYGSTLSAAYSGGNNTGTLSYKWSRDGVEVASATGTTYLLTAADIGHRISCIVRSSNEIGAVMSDETVTVSKAERSAPAAPVLKRMTALSDSSDCTITIATAAECIYMLGNGIEIDPGNASELTFEGLMSETTYEIRVRFKENTTHEASDFSAPLRVTTDAKDNSALIALIKRAKDARAGINISANGKDVSVSEKWVTNDIYSLLSGSITKAQSVVDNKQADRSALINMIDEITESINTFIASIKKG
ncbi:MAG: hypothetical protein Q4B67_05705, partial [Eubacteriales bacterium]|nr:hypothetical protein [Eubacteriales bacterium]